MVIGLTPLTGGFPELAKYLRAGAESASPDELVKLSFDSSEKIRQRVAENRNTPITILAKLASDDNIDVRLAVSDNPHTPSGLLLILAGDENPDVRYGLAENCNIPTQILVLLARDCNPYVAHRATDTLSRKGHPSLRSAA